TARRRPTKTRPIPQLASGRRFPSSAGHSQQRVAFRRRCARTPAHLRRLFDEWFETLALALRLARRVVRIPMRVAPRRARTHLLAPTAGGVLPMHVVVRPLSLKDAGHPYVAPPGRRLS